MQFFRGVLLLTIIWQGASWCVAPANFSQAKKIAGQLFHDHPQTLYCQCRYDAKKHIDLTSCGMQEAGGIKRAHRMEWEHMMPAEQFGKHFLCWREPLCTKNGKPFKGRRCCEQMDAKFRQMEAELYNLWPAVGLVNQTRSNYRFSALPEHKGFLGCDFNADKASHRAEPSDAAKGIVARANLFVADYYGIRLSDRQRKLFNAWHRQFAPTAWERQWAAEVAAIEGYSNPYIQ